MIVLPTVLDVIIAARYPHYIEGLHSLISAIYVITSLMIMAEAAAAWRTAPPRPDAARPLPRCTAVIAAYLPNEQEILLETIAHMLSRVDVPDRQFQVILAYNTPETLPIEAQLREIAETDPRLCLLRVTGSKSKAENVNAALKIATGEIIGIYDADHVPQSDCFQKAWLWLSDGFDIVQGRCRIRNYDTNRLTRIVAVEFDVIYAISHPGRTRLSQTAIFGGSNGYWRREALQAALLDPAMLTEDIDASVRAILAGRRLTHDRSIVSDELAPVQIKHWIIQRKRWAQGWLEVTLKHQKALLKSKHLGPVQKIFWFYLLGWRELYPFLATQFYPMLFAAALLGIPIHWFGNPFFIAVGIINLGSGPFVLWVASRTASPRERRGMRLWYVIYAVTSLLYSSLKTLVTVVAQYSHLIHDREWITTPRSAEDAH